MTPYDTPKGEIGTPSSHESSIIPSEFDERATKRLLRKLDLRIVPFFALLYLWVTPTSSLGVDTYIFPASAFWIGPILEMLAWLILRVIFT